jgi:hypothetical protein
MGHKLGTGRISSRCLRGYCGELDLTPDYVVPAFDRIIVGHGKIVETDGKRQLTCALREAGF